MNKNKENLIYEIRFRVTPEFKKQLTDHFRHSDITLSENIRQLLSDQIKSVRTNKNRVKTAKEQR
jgi:hypothetical protein